VLLITNNQQKVTSLYCIPYSDPNTSYIMSYTYNQSLGDNLISGQFSDSVTHISFQNSNFQQFPRNLLGFYKLERINANHCGLKTLDVSTFRGWAQTGHPKLKIVDLAANEITDISAKAFVKLPHLRKLNLANNQITTIDDDAFDRLEDLVWLNLNNNSIVTLNVNIFAGLQSLFKIYLNKNEMTFFDLDIFKNNEQLSQVRLSQNEITDIWSIGQLDNKNIEVIFLNENKLFDISALHHMKAMKTLQISDNMNLQLHSQLFTDMPQLTHLYMYETNLHRLKNDFTLFSSLRNLEVLAIGRNSLYNLDFTHFPNLSSLEFLDLNENGLTSIDVNRLKKKCPSLRLLTIGKNNWDCSYLTKLTNDMASLRINVNHKIFDEFGGYKNIKITENTTRSISGIGCDLQESSNLR
jgi:Leucine-rich repeat (LRR) protein